MFYSLKRVKIKSFCDLSEEELSFLNSDCSTIVKYKYPSDDRTTYEIFFRIPDKRKVIFEKCLYVDYGFFKP